MKKSRDFCNDYGDAAGCLKTPDERYTMDFKVLGEPALLWCSACGPGAHKMWGVIENALAERGDAFEKDFEAQVEAAEKSCTFS